MLMTAATARATLTLAVRAVLRPVLRTVLLIFTLLVVRWGGTLPGLCERARGCPE
jgi:hypothetical protein